MKIALKFITVKLAECVVSRHYTNFVATVVICITSYPFKLVSTLDRSVRFFEAFQTIGLHFTLKVCHYNLM